MKPPLICGMRHRLSQSCDSLQRAVLLRAFCSGTITSECPHSSSPEIASSSIKSYDKVPGRDRYQFWAIFGGCCRWSASIKSRTSGRSRRCFTTSTAKLYGWVVWWAAPICSLSTTPTRSKRCTGKRVLRPSGLPCPAWCAIRASCARIFSANYPVSLACRWNNNYQRIISRRLIKTREN